MYRKAADIAETINRQMDRFLPAIIPFGVVLGYLMPGVFIHLRPFVPLIFGMMTLSGALKLKAAEFGRTIRSPLPILAFFFSSHVLMPVFAKFIASLFFSGNDELITGYILLFAGPIAVSSFIWVTIYSGEKALCLTIILLDTLLVPVFVPGTLALLMGANVSLDIKGIVLSLVLMVVIPTAAGVSLNESTKGKIPLLICPFLNPLAKISLVTVIAANTASVAALIRLDDPLIWKVAALVVFLFVLGFLLSWLTGIVTGCSPEKCKTLFFSGGLRNNTVTATITLTFFSEYATLPVIMIILFQHSISAILAKLLIRKNPV